MGDTNDETQTEEYYEEEDFEKEKFPLNQESSKNTGAHPDIISDANFFLQEPIKKFSLRLSNAHRKEEMRTKAKTDLEDHPPEISVRVPSLSAYLLPPKDGNPGSNPIFKERLAKLERDFIREYRGILSEAVDSDIARAKAEYANLMELYTTECVSVFDTEYRRTRSSSSASSFDVARDTWITQAKTKVDAEAKDIFRAQNKKDKRKSTGTTTTSVNSDNSSHNKKKTKPSSNTTDGRSGTSRNSSSSSSSGSNPSRGGYSNAGIIPISNTANNNTALDPTAIANLSELITSNVMKSLAKNGIGAKQTPKPRAPEKNKGYQHTSRQNGNNANSKVGGGNQRR